MSAPAPVYVTATAYVASQRSGALDPLDPEAPWDAEPARFWADPALLQQAIGLLEELGLVTVTADRSAVAILGPPTVFESAFGVALDWDGEGRLWRLRNATTDPFLIVPKGAEQVRLLRGILLEEPAVPVEDLTGYEQQVRKTDKNGHPYATLPHELRRELCQDRIPQADFLLPRGDAAPRRPIHIVVVDTGWDPGHPYWEAAGLGGAAKAVEVIENAYLTERRATITPGVRTLYQSWKETLEGYQEDLKLARGGLIRKRNPQALRMVTKHWPKTMLEVLRKVASDGSVESMFRSKALSGRIAPVLAFDGNKLSWDDITTLASVFGFLVDRADMYLNLLSRPYDETRHRDPDAHQHGSCVIGQLLGVAPAARITLIRNNAHLSVEEADGLPPLMDVSWSMDSLRTQIEHQQPDLVSLSVTQLIRVDQGQALARRDRLKIARFARFVNGMRRKSCAVVVAVGNRSNLYKQENGQEVFRYLPENNFVPPAGERRNLIQVGGAWWPQRHGAVGPGSRQGCRGSGNAVGYGVTAGTTPYVLPAVCGLMKPDQGNPLLYHPVMEQKPGDAKPRARLRPAEGTSFAAPQVAGIAALMLEAEPMLRSHPTLLRDLLTASATPLVSGTAGGNPAEAFLVPPGRSAPKPGQAPGMVDLRRSVEGARGALFAVLDEQLQANAAAARQIEVGRIDQDDEFDEFHDFHDFHDAPEFDDFDDFPDVAGQESGL